VNTTNVTDPNATFKNVQEHFEKIQLGFDNMKKAVSSTKTQLKTELSNWVFQASRTHLPPSLDQPNSAAQVGISDGMDDIEIIDKKDPILLALEKETAFDP